MKKIDISEVLGSNLLSRPLARELKRIAKENNRDSKVTIDFNNVVFATRSFMDEFYNIFILDQDIDTTLENVPSNVQSMLDAVARTQCKKKSAASTNVSRPATLRDVEKCFMAILL